MTKKAKISSREIAEYFVRGYDSATEKTGFIYMLKKGKRDKKFSREDAETFVRKNKDSFF